MAGFIPGKNLGSRELLMRLVVAEVLAPPGEGPLAPRFARPWARAPVSGTALEKTPSGTSTPREEP